MTKKELLGLISEEINLDEDQSINLVEIINRAALTESTKTTSEDKQEEWEGSAEEIRSELERACIEIETKRISDEDEGH